VKPLYLRGNDIRCYPPYMQAEDAACPGDTDFTWTELRRLLLSPVACTAYTEHRTVNRKRRNTCPSATLFTTDPTGPGPRMNRGFGDDRRASNQPPEPWHGVEAEFHVNYTEIAIPATPKHCIFIARLSSCWLGKYSYHCALEELCQDEGVSCIRQVPVRHAEDWGIARHTL
jgi:hypothetical protein